MLGPGIVVWVGFGYEDKAAIVRSRLLDLVQYRDLIDSAPGV